MSTDAPIIPPLPNVYTDDWIPPLLIADDGKEVSQLLSEQYTIMIVDINVLFQKKPLPSSIIMFSSADENKKLMYVNIWPLMLEGKEKLGVPANSKNLLLEFSKTKRKQSFAYLNEHIQFCEKKALSISFYDVQPTMNAFPIMAQFVFDADDMPASYNLPELTEDVDNATPVSYLSNAKEYNEFMPKYNRLSKLEEHMASATQDKKKTVIGTVTSELNSIIGRIPMPKANGINGALINSLIHKINKAWPGFVNISNKLEFMSLMDGTYDDYIRFDKTWQESDDFWFFQTCDGYYYLHMKFPGITQKLQEDIIMTPTLNKELFEHMHKYTNMIKRYKRIDDTYNQYNAVEITVYKENPQQNGVVCIQFKFASRPPSRAGPIKPICKRPDTNPYDDEYNHPYNIDGMSTDYDCLARRSIKTECLAKGGSNPKKRKFTKKKTKLQKYSARRIRYNRKINGAKKSVSIRKRLLVSFGTRRSK
jgi:hypothetical protein